MKEKRQKGLCYYNDTQWSLGHKCLKPKLYLIDEICGPPELECALPKWIPKMSSEEPSTQAYSKKSPKISLHAITSSANPKTLGLNGKYVTFR